MPPSVDLLVVGAGIYGASAAHAASARGRSVLLLDRGDLAGGASSNSMKLAHGGLRYLQSLDLPRALESVRERRRLLRLAPHLVRPLPVRLELAGRSRAYRLLFRCGLLANELVSWHRNRGVPPEARIPRSRYPRWHDALIEDPERLLLGLLHSARAARPDGLEVRPHTRLESVERRPDGRSEARLADGSRVLAGAVLRCPGAARAGQPVVLSMNLVVDGLPLTARGEAVGLAHPDGRNVFAVPWRGCTILGTYDREYPYEPSEPLRVDRAWVKELLEWLGPVHADLAGLSPSRVRLVHAGLLPRGPGPRPEPADRPWMEPLAPGDVDVQGVKWTTAYGVASRAVDRTLGPPTRAERTRPEPPFVDGLAERARYVGGAAGRAAPLLPGRCSLPQGALEFAVEREWARDLGDVLLRRTALATAGHPGRDVSRAAAAVLQRARGWSDAETRAQLEAFDEAPCFLGNVPAAERAR